MMRFRRYFFASLLTAGLLCGLLPRPTIAQTGGEQAAYASAAALQEQGLFDLAADAWRELLERDPQSDLAPRARYNLGVCRFHAGAFAEAARLFATVTDGEQFPDLAEAAWANLGLAQLNAGRGRLSNPQHDPQRVETDLRAAIEAFDRGLAAFPTGAQAVSSQFYRGEALSMLGDHRAAVKAFRTVLASNDTKNLARPTRIGLASALLELGEFKQVESALGELAQDTSARLLAAEARLLRGEARLGLKQYVTAAEDFDAAASTEGFVDGAYATERAGFSRYLAKDYAGAAAAYDRLVRQFPGSPLAAAGRVSAGKCWLLADDPAKAVEQLAAAWQASPTSANADAARWWGRALLKLDRAEASLAAARAALALKPSDPRPLQLLAADSLLAINGKQPEAVTAFERFANDWPDDPATPRALLTAATTALKLKQEGQASRLANQFLQQHDDHPRAIEARTVVATAAFRSNKWDVAAKAYTELLNNKPDDPQAASWRLRLADAQRGLGQLADARQTLDRLLDRPGDNPLAARALYERGRLLTNLGDLSAANADFTAAIQSASDTPLVPYARLALATNQYTAGNAQACITTLLTTGQPPEIEGARYLLATAQHATQQFAEALATLDTAKVPEVNRLRLEALCRIGLKEIDAASSVIKQFTQQFPQHPAGAEIAYELAWLYRDLGRSEEAAERFARVPQNYPESPLVGKAHFRAGEGRREAGQLGAAGKAFAAAARAAAQAEPRDDALLEQSLHLLGWTRSDDGRRDEAADVFRQQLSAAPTGPLAYAGRLMLGECLFAEEKYAEALASYRQAFASEASHSQAGVNKTAESKLRPLALLHAGQATGQVGDWQASLDLLERARKELADTSHATQAAYERAWALHKLGRDAEAAPELTRIADQAPGALAARAAFVRGELHFAAKQYKQAVRMFFRVAYGFGGRDAAPEYHLWQAESLFEAARCLEQLDRLEPALKLYAELIERFPESPKAKLAKDRLTETAAGAGY